MIFKIFEEFTQAQFEPIKSFKLQDELNPEFWTDFKLDEKIEKDLIQIGNDYFKELDLGNVELEDLIFTGSLANFNWSKYSDIDLHLVFDFKDVNEDTELVRKYLDAVEKAWKLQHNIQINGYDVEIYCQSIDDKLAATGVYSLFDKEWQKKPKKEEFVLDEESIRKKAKIYMQAINDLEKGFKEGKTYDQLKSKTKKIWKKIKDARKSGLEKQGELSIENLVFKLLRRNGYIERFMDLRRKSYDKQYK